MRTHTYVLVLAVVVVAALAGGALARIETAQMTTSAVIDQALERGAIDYPHALLLKAYSLYDPSKLPAEFEGGKVDKCGVPIIDEIERALPALPQDIADEITQYRVRPTNQTYIDTEHFRIHYDTSGTHMILGWPNTAYRDAVCVSAELCWTEEVTNLGFRQPPSDGPFPGNGGDGRYDIYVQALSGVYGYTQYEYTVPSTPQNDATSFVVIDNDYTGFGYPNPQDPMKVTVAHEFNHSCQAAHDYQEATWYKECSATWMEDVVYDSINDYRNYLTYFLGYPYWSLEVNDGAGLRIYGSCIWNFFLSENHGNNIVREIWTACETGAAYPSMNLTLLNYSSSLQDAYRNFAIWNFFTSIRNDGNHYQEGGSWPVVPMQKTHSSFPVVDQSPVASQLPDHMGCNYIRFNYPYSGWNGLHIAYDGPQPISQTNYAYITYVPQTGLPGEIGDITLNGFGNGEITVADWNLMSYVSMVVINPNTTGDNMVYLYDAEEVDTAVEGEVYELALRPASPNPFTETTSIAYTVPTGGGFVEITVYDVAGREVRALVSDTLPAGDGVVIWDGVDNGGSPVAAGVYFARIDLDGLTESGKLLMLK